MKEFFKASLRTAIAIFLALIALAIVIGIFTWAKDYYDKEGAVEYEKVRNWEFNLKDNLGVEAHAKTKLVANNLLASIEVIGYPKYFSDPRNKEGYLNIEFLDIDGFKVITKSVKISEFTTIVGGNGESFGLSYQFEDHIGLENYKRLYHMQVGWNLITEAEVQKPVAEKILDHCAPNISKSERLKRLEKHGTLRETGNNTYTAANHSVSFLSYDGELLNCW
jgi:hypothetical protein